MKSLYLLRHAKSSWDQPGIADRDRVLSSRGIRSCDLMAEYFRLNDIVPDIVWCSTARRTRETLERIAPRAGWTSSHTAVTLAEELYLATSSEILAHLRLTGDGAARVMIIGHNPGLEQLASALIRDDPGGHRAALERRYPTAGLAIYAYDGPSWSSLAEQSCLLRDFVTPRRLEGN